MTPYAWLAVAVLMALVEVISFGLITVWFVIGALAAFLLSLAGFGMIAQLLAFLAVSVLCLGLLRPLFLKYRKHGQESEPTYVGQSAVVVEAIDNDRAKGRVETSNHMTWSALSNNGDPIEKGAVVTIVERKSVKLIVERKEA